jgi:hypothetical protein
MKKFPRYRRTEPLTIKITRGRVAFAIVFALLVSTGAALASGSNPIDTEQRQQDVISNHYLQVQPLPAFSGKSQIRQNLIEIENAEVVGAQSTLFFCPPMGCTKASPPMYQCPSIGAPIQVEDQLSNPDQPERDNSQPLNNGGGNITIKNMDPNGIYQGGGTGTYVLCIGKGGAVTPFYWEGYVASTFAAATWNDATGQIQITGPPSFKFTR